VQRIDGPQTPKLHSSHIKSKLNQNEELVQCSREFPDMQLLIFSHRFSTGSQGAEKHSGAAEEGRVLSGALAFLDGAGVLPGHRPALVERSQPG
jgi:hypothetical protein